MYAFEYRRPATLEDACKALDSLAESKPLAGGMSIVPVMRQRLASPAALIDLGRIDDPGPRQAQSTAGRTFSGPGSAAHHEQRNQESAFEGLSDLRCSCCTAPGTLTRRDGRIRSAKRVNR